MPDWTLEDGTSMVLRMVILLRDAALATGTEAERQATVAYLRGCDCQDAGEWQRALANIEAGLHRPKGQAN